MPLFKVKLFSNRYKKYYHRPLVQRPDCYMMGTTRPIQDDIYRPIQVKQPIPSKGMDFIFPTSFTV